MRLSNFIRENEAQILEEWEHLASRLRSEIVNTDRHPSRAWAKEMLAFVVDDLDASPGAKPRSSRDEHYRDGDIAELLLLRAVVIHLWGGTGEQLDRDDLVQFSSTIDRRASESMPAMVNHDQLTGVPNRRLFLDRLEQDIRMTRRKGGLLALLYIDIDNFKRANERFGQEGGDELLRQVAGRIGSCIRETDTVARMGSDEFTVLLMDVSDRQRVAAVARAVLTRLSRPYSIDDEMVELVASIGVGLYPEHGEMVDDLLASAERAMGSARQAGGDRIAFFTAEDPARMSNRRPAPGERRQSH